MTNDQGVTSYGEPKTGRKEPKEGGGLGGWIEARRQDFIDLSVAWEVPEAGPEIEIEVKSLVKDTHKNVSKEYVPEIVCVTENEDGSENIVIKDLAHQCCPEMIRAYLRLGQEDDFVRRDFFVPRVTYKKTELIEKYRKLSKFDGRYLGHQPEMEPGDDTETKPYIFSDHTFEGDCCVEFLKFEHSSEAREIFWHSSGHLLALAIERVFGGMILFVSAGLQEGGFYCDFLLPENSRNFNDSKNFDNSRIDELTLPHKLMQEIEFWKDPAREFERQIVTKRELVHIFRYNPFKLNYIAKNIQDDQLATIYRCGTFIDLCRGPNVRSLQEVGDAFMIQKYETRKYDTRLYGTETGNGFRTDRIHRVYGISFPTHDMLTRYQKYGQWDLDVVLSPQ